MFLEADEEINYFSGCATIVFYLYYMQKIVFFCLFYFGLNIRKEICKVHILGSATQLMLNEREVLLSH